jgi:ketol-acid reductoisomerase
MNRVISDTAEYGCYLFDQACKPLLADFMKTVDTDLVGKNFNDNKDAAVDNAQLVVINEILRDHPVEIVGRKLRKAMTAMKAIKTV